eukprot:CAMPEP_0119369928 /NCGR_PEP_ID=MMETSP1334-20130426/16381_1 /TAXON_ID=127549 /ORGANISM="Calcidiscus leptoporus, Strain RCC1130" /LENGTH=65 /DNA_ID=CAMNT_0007386877 /DNA_START=53 /DNA_END=248 /DNA_ORIENTATION=+
MTRFQPGHAHIRPQRDEGAIGRPPRSDLHMFGRDEQVLMASTECDWDMTGARPRHDRDIDLGQDL